jgi:hypothetical protein
MGCPLTVATVPAGNDSLKQPIADMARQSMHKRRNCGIGTPKFSF